MDISRYLAAFIKEQKEVNVPGLGTFYRQQVPAKYDAANNRFLPPAEHIHFKNTFTEDTSLVHYISKAENTEPKSVAYFLEQYVSNLNDLLANTEQIKIDALGSFEKTKTGYTFEANEDLMPATYYGLKPQNEIGDQNNSQMIVEEDEEEEDFPKQANFKKNILLILIIILAGFAALQFLQPQWLYSLKKLISPKTQNTVPLTTPDTLAKISNTAIADTSSVKVIDTLSTSALSAAPSYEIIVAAFSKRTEADQYIEQLKSKGFEAHVLEPKAREYFKISTGTFTDEKAAQTELKRIQTELSASAWIFHVKPIKNQ